MNVRVRPTPILSRVQITERSRLTGRTRTWVRYQFAETTADALAAHARPGRTVSVCAVKNLPRHIDPNLSRRAIVHSLEAPQEWAVIKDLAGAAFAIGALALALYLLVPELPILGEALASALLR